MRRPRTAASTTPDPLAALEQAIGKATGAMLGRQRGDGHWVFELEADATIPAEYILLRHYLGEREPELEAKIVVYLREIQGDHGGWPLFHAGPLDISASVKAYFALKMAGEATDAPHMVRAREAILAQGGAARANVFTRVQLALFGDLPWRAVPVMPAEIMLLPRWFPFHLDKLSYWSRTVIVPLLVLMAKKPQARNPLGIHVPELFTTPPDQVQDWHVVKDKSFWGAFFRKLDDLLHKLDPYFPGGLRRRAIIKAVDFVLTRLNGEDGLGGIYPAIANARMMYDCLGYGPDDPNVRTVESALRKLLVVEDGRAYCQPCLSPVWDTALTTNALCEVGSPEAREAAAKAVDWLVARQVTGVIGDWAVQRPGLRPGGWAFQYENPHYPDVDDTAVAVVGIDRAVAGAQRPAVERAVEWIIGMQSRNGGWGAFDADNTHYALNHIPFADHGALLDPPTADVSARCVSMLCHLGYKADHPAVAQGLAYLRREQEAEGCWFGRWGTNYIYGTWSVLCAFNAAGIDHQDPQTRKGVEWLLSKQCLDGGWGESGRSYYEGEARGVGPVSTPSQTAWALLGLMAAGEADHPAVARGIAYLQANQSADGLWEEKHFTSVGFPRVFYLRYHGYRAIFPLWALARYRNLKVGNSSLVTAGL